eukprot:5717526-Prymnesium_polylepis.1
MENPERWWLKTRQAPAERGDGLVPVWSAASRGVVADAGGGRPSSTGGDDSAVGGRSSVAVSYTHLTLPTICSV